MVNDLFTRNRGILLWYLADDPFHGTDRNYRFLGAEYYPGDGGEGGTDQLHSSADLLPTKGGFPTSRNFYVRTHVNKINAIMVG